MVSKERLQELEANARKHATMILPPQLETGDGTAYEKFLFLALYGATKALGVSLEELEKMQHADINTFVETETAKLLSEYLEAEKSLEEKVEYNRKVAYKRLRAIVNGKACELNEIYKIDTVDRFGRINDQIEFKISDLIEFDNALKSLPDVRKSPKEFSQELFKQYHNVSGEFLVQGKNQKGSKIIHITLEWKP